MQSWTQSDRSLPHMFESVRDDKVVCTVRGLASMCFTSALMVMLRLLRLGMAKTALNAEADMVPANAQPTASFVSRVIAVSCESILRNTSRQYKSTLQATVRLS